NRATYSSGGGILLGGDTDAVVVQNALHGNTAEGAGGGLASFAVGGLHPTVTNNTFTSNTAPVATALYAATPATVSVTNNVMQGPAGRTVVECQAAAYADLRHNDLFNGDPSATVTAGCGAVVGVNGNIATDPRFTTYGSGTLRHPSPAMDAGQAPHPLLPGTDIQGNPRVVDGDGNGTAIVDMGAYESAGPDAGPAQAWGWNPVGELGDGTTLDRHLPQDVAGLTQVVQVAGGIYHSLALRADGTVWAWGWNGLSQLGDGTTTDRHSPVPVAGLANVVAVSAGAYHSLAVKADGTVWAWGWNGVGQLGDGTTTDRYTPVAVAGLTGVSQVSAGAFHNLARKGGGTVWSWGWNALGQLGDGTTTDRHTPVPVAGLSDVTELAAGHYHNIAVQQGSIYLWGWNFAGQLGTKDTVDRLVPTRSNGASGMVRVAAGAAHTLALEGDGTVYAWGWNPLGQVGDGTTTDRNFPVFLGFGGENGVVEIAAGAYHSVLLHRDGTIKAWGWNVAGQVGDGTTTDRHAPVAVPVGPGTQAIGAGAFHTMGG
ncbi:MAG: choice-of-anchor Q domain-containing protein, partial [Acidimicrobiales bacterium]